VSKADAGASADAAPPPVYCVAQAGSRPCPSPYTVPHAPGDASTPYVDGVADGRTCTCSCGAPSGVVCNSDVSLYAGPGCSGPPQGTVVEAGPATCAALTGVTAASSSCTAEGGSCSAYGGPTGGLTPGAAYTVCCTR
jgi:hypothetical protein